MALKQAWIYKMRISATLPEGQWLLPDRHLPASASSGVAGGPRDRARKKYKLSGLELPCESTHHRDTESTEAGIPHSLKLPQSGSPNDRTLGRMESPLWKK